MLAAGGLEPLDALQARLDAEPPTPGSAPLAGVSVRGRAGRAADSLQVRNVVGQIRARGHSRRVCRHRAHYDHVGLTSTRTFFGWRSGPAQIHNGADDNASGTAGVIELGRVLAKERDLKRSLLLIAFTAEESVSSGASISSNTPLSRSKSSPPASIST